MKVLKFFLIIAVSVAFASEKVAVAIKIIGDVTISTQESEGFSALKRGTPLSHKDVIRTGQGGFIVAMYLDDKTTIKISENSEFVINGERSDGNINKQVSVAYGTLHASVAKQKGSEFVISTPTSVASIKGTDFVVVCDPVQGDMFVTLIGVIEVTNNVTGTTTPVAKGETATSTPDGNVEVHVSTEEETETFKDETEEDEAPTQKELRFEIEDQEGGKHEVIIKYE